MRRTSRAALTLVEMLVAMAVSLIMMGAVVTIFGTMGNSITDSRAIMEISERLRNCRNVLQRDLGNITVTMLPPRRPESDEGFFEYIEGLTSDFWPNAEWPNGPASPPADSDVPNYFTPPLAPSAARSLAGDVTDILMFTARSRGEPYVGTVNGSSVQSLTAEVCYFTALAPNTPTIIDAASGQQFQLRTLYRRVLLVNPSTGPIAPQGGETLVDFRGKHDLSVRYDGTNFVPNTLGDLTKRENRYGHDPATFPFVANQGAALAGDRAGDDVLLTNVLAFDVKAFDPNVAVRVTNSGVATVPSDPGYGISTNTLGGSGGYVDLNYNRYTPAPSSQGSSYFSDAGSPLYMSQPAAQRFPLPTYDPWSLHYEQNGVDENGDTVFDSGMNGLDDGGAPGIVDDPAEQEAPPPYPVPLRGIQIKIRVYEPDSRQVREVTVVQDFMPQ